MKQVKTLKGVKPLKNAHTPNTKFGMGDFYGSGVKNPTGKVIEGVGKTIPKSKIGTPPKKLG